MVTCYLRYVIDPSRLADFEHYSRLCTSLAERFGGSHLGQFLSPEGDGDVALSLFSFPGRAAYEDYLAGAASDPQGIAVAEYARQTGCIRSHERNLLRPVHFGAGRESGPARDTV